MTLTDAAIKEALAGVVLKDHVVAGLQVRCFAGRKSFYLYYRTKGGKQRKPKLGDWPLLALPRARGIARQMLDTVAGGGDPQGQRETERAAPTVDDLGERYMLEHGDGKKSARDDRRLVRLYLSRLKHDRVMDLNFDRISAWHKAIRAKVQANRALALLSKALNLAEQWTWRPIGSNPCQHVARNPERRRRRYMTLDEAKAVSAGLASRVAAYPQAVAFLYLLIYTGARLDEIGKAKWSQIERRNSGSILRLDVHKTDQDQQPRIIHLPPQVSDILDALPRTKNGTICGIKNPYKTWYSIRKEAGCPDLRQHDLRHSFASAALAAGLDLAEIGELLGHKSVQTTKGYAHLMDDIAAARANTTGEMIAARLAGTVDG